MGNKNYTKGAALERQLVADWKQFLELYEVPGGAIRSAGSRGNIDVLVWINIGNHTFAWGIQAKVGLKPTAAVVNNYTQLALKTVGIPIVVAWRPRGKTMVQMIPFNPMTTAKELIKSFKEVANE